MKNKKYLIIGIISLLLVVGCVVGIYFYCNPNRLTITEKKWIDDNLSTSQIINVNVINNADGFGRNGQGVFYDFLNDFENNYNLELNKITTSFGENTSSVTLTAKNKITDKDTVIYTDHYVVVGNNFEVINNLQDLSGKSVRILARDLQYVSTVLNNVAINYTTVETDDELFISVINDGYAIMPLHLYLQRILSGGFNVLYHLSDVNIYYVLSSNDDVISSILTKYYNTWKDSFKDSYNQNMFNIIKASLNITDTEIDAIQSVSYAYGFINNSPYEVISGGNYGGIAAVYIKNFMDFANLDFKFTKYRNYNSFIKAIANDKVDVYFDYYNSDNDFAKINTGIPVNYVVVANNKNDIVINSLNTLVGKTVYVEANSFLYNYLSGINGIKVKTYKNSKDLCHLNKKDEIILLDKNIYEYYQSHGLKNYTIRYEESLNYMYTLRTKNNSAMYKLLDRYVNILDNQKVLNEGIYNHEVTIRAGHVLSSIAKYFIYLLIILVIIGLIFLRKTKKVIIAKKIKKDDKLKFIDQLTLLKNRNYLSENIEKWNNNTIYPQAIIIVDLNKVRYINDVEGYEAGDKQIKAAANVLIKTQLDNTEIIRTNGNEFVIYMVGYSQKQVTNYIHKINKEFKKLPYTYGAEFGYSMIIDDIKTIEDALNEATSTLKKQKEVVNEEKN